MNKLDIKNIKLERNYEVSEITKRAEILIAIYKNTDDKSELQKLMEIQQLEYCYQQIKMKQL